MLCVYLFSMGEKMSVVNYKLIRVEILEVLHDEICVMEFTGRNPTRAISVRLSQGIYVLDFPVVKHFYSRINNKYRFFVLPLSCRPQTSLLERLQIPMKFFSNVLCWDVRN